jgi:hypothetical protein
MKRQYEVHIDHLVLPKSAVGSRQIRAAIERELARSIDVAGPKTSVSIEGVEVTAGGAAHPGVIGDKVSRAIRRKLSPR